MITVNNLSLRIYGGALDGGMEAQPLVAVGSVPNEFRPIPPMIVDEQQVWMITHAQSYTLYAVYSKRCRTAEDLPGQILICIFLPPQQRLADGNSPLGLLDSLMDSFAVQALRGGKLPNTSIDNSPFKVLLGRYRLEERPVLLPIMQGPESSAFCVDSKTQLDAIMRHSRYPVLSGVSRLELGYHCNSTIMLKTQGASSKKVDKVAQPVTTAEPEQPKPADQIRGGLSLDDEPITSQGTPWYKKLLKVAAIFIGVLLGLFVVLAIVGSFMDDDKKQHVAENKSISAEVQEDEIGSDETLVLKEEVEENKNAELPAQEAQQEPQERAGQTDDQVSQKEAEAAAKKRAEAEAAKKKADAEEAKKKAEEAAKSAKWQANVQQYANSCPIQLRIGVRLTSIVCTPNSVTYTVNYEELSKYDMDSDDRNDLATDRSNILKKYGAGIPSNVHTSIIQKDKAGRTL